MARYTAKVPGFGKQGSSVGAYVPQKDIANPLDQPMEKRGNQSDTTGFYLDNQRQVFGTPKWGLNVEKADQIRYNAEKMRYATHGKYPAADDQKGGV